MLLQQLQQQQQPAAMRAAAPVVQGSASCCTCASAAAVLHCAPSSALLPLPLLLLHMIAATLAVRVIRMVMLQLCSSSRAMVVVAAVAGLDGLLASAAAPLQAYGRGCGSVPTAQGSVPYYSQQPQLTTAQAALPPMTASVVVDRAAGCSSPIMRHNHQKGRRCC